MVIAFFLLLFFGRKVVIINLLLGKSVALDFQPPIFLCACPDCKLKVMVGFKKSNTL